MYYCKNCGHSSHCGTPFYRQDKDYDGREYSVEVCKHCICDKCQTKETENG